MEIRADVGEHGLNTVMLIAELDVNAAMNAPLFHENTAVAPIQRMKHAFEVPQLLHDPGLASAMRTTPLNFYVVLVDRKLDIAWCADGGPPPSSPIEGWSVFCPRPDRRCSA
eukprot:2670371-Pleurochrysis_carterae.AAC.1